MSENESLPDEDKANIIMMGLDTNSDEKAGPWEMLRWMEWVEDTYRKVTIPKLKFIERC